MNLVSRALDSLVLAVWGVVALGFVATGRIGTYLHPSFHGWAMASGCVLLALAGLMIFLPEGCSKCCGGHEEGGWLGKLLKSAILVVPLLLAVVVSPSQFGAVAVRNRGLADSLAVLPGYSTFREPALPTPDGSSGEEGPEIPLSEMLDVDAQGRIHATVVDLLYAANIPELQRDFEGKKVLLVGQYLPAHRNNPAGNRFSLVRMFIMCCAADARPLGIPVNFASASSPPPFPEMSWIQVSGIARFPVEGGRVVPVIEAQEVEPCEAPSETFLY